MRCGAQAVRPYLGTPAEGHRKQKGGRLFFWADGGRAAMDGERGRSWSIARGRGRKRGQRQAKPRSPSQERVCTRKAGRERRAACGAACNVAEKCSREKEANRRTREMPVGVSVQTQRGAIARGFSKSGRTPGVHVRVRPQPIFCLHPEGGSALKTQSLRRSSNRAHAELSCFRSRRALRADASFVASFLL